ncbi:MAG TPA: endo-1,4-beta-xylanase [Polyangiaceae bacterium]|nr:endo-1,4-beta-xylanase [Polyangiaceae bacterium]
MACGGSGTDTPNPSLEHDASGAGGTAGKSMTGGAGGGGVPTPTAGLGGGGSAGAGTGGGAGTAGSMQSGAGGSGATAGSAGAGGSAGRSATGGAGAAGAGAAGAGGAENGGAAGRAGMAGAAGRGGAAGGGGPYELEFVGNITTSDSVDTDGKTFSKHWDQITPENAGKWGSVQSSAGAAYNWRTLDAIYDYTEKAGIAFKEHAFVWGSQQPSGSIGEADVKAWMKAFCTRYPNTKVIDVVNEPPPHTTPSYANAIGGGTNGTWQWITNAFLWAREACPNAVLVLNDYSNIEYKEHQDRYISIVQTIQAAGAPIDAVGAQSHDLDDEGMQLATVKGFVEHMYAETGLPIYVTEMDIDQTDDQAQLRYYQDYFPYFRDSGVVKGLTIWGWIYGKTWSVAPNSGLVRNGTSRPAMTWLMQQLDRPVP